MNERYLGGDKEEKRYKIVLVGDVNVGKTALFWRFTESGFLATKEPQVTTIDFKLKSVLIQSKPVKLYIWDTVGQERYRSIVSTYFKGCHGIILVFDLSREATFSSIRSEWFPLCQAKADKAKFLLVGAKSDLDRRIPLREVEEWCTANSIKYLEASSKTGKNVDEVFIGLARTIFLADELPSNAAKALKTSDTPKGKCCAKK